MAKVALRIAYAARSKNLQLYLTEAAWALWKFFFILFPRHFGQRKSLWQWACRFNTATLLWFQMCCWDVWGEVFFKQLFDGLRSYLNFLDNCVDCLIQMRNSNCQNLSFLTHLHTRLYLYKKNLLFSKYIFMFILEPNQLPHLWWCEEKPLLDRNVSTYIVNRTRTAVGYKTVRRTSKSSNWYCLHGMYCM